MSRGQSINDSSLVSSPGHMISERLQRLAGCTILPNIKGSVSATLALGRNRNCVCGCEVHSDNQVWGTKLWWQIESERGVIIGRRQDIYDIMTPICICKNNVLPAESKHKLSEQRNLATAVEERVTKCTEPPDQWRIMSFIFILHNIKLKYKKVFVLTYSTCEQPIRKRRKWLD